MDTLGVSEASIQKKLLQDKQSLVKFALSEAKKYISLCKSKNISVDEQSLDLPIFQGDWTSLADVNVYKMVIQRKAQLLREISKQGKVVKKTPQAFIFSDQESDAEMDSKPRTNVFKTPAVPLTPTVHDTKDLSEIDASFMMLS